MTVVQVHKSMDDCCAGELQRLYNGNKPESIGWRIIHVPSMVHTITACWLAEVTGAVAIWKLWIKKESATKIWLCFSTSHVCSQPQGFIILCGLRVRHSLLTRWSSAKPRNHLSPSKLLGDALAFPNPLYPAACCRSWLKTLKALGGVLWCAVWVLSLNFWNTVTN